MCPLYRFLARSVPCHHINTETFQIPSLTRKRTKFTTISLRLFAGKIACCIISLFPRLSLVYLFRSCYELYLLGKSDPSLQKIEAALHYLADAQLTMQQVLSEGISAQTLCPRTNSPYFLSAVHGTTPFAVSFC